MYKSERGVNPGSVIGSYHQVSAKHLDAYLDELEFRFNDRENPHMFRDAMCKLLVANFQGLDSGFGLGPYDP